MWLGAFQQLLLLGECLCQDLEQCPSILQRFGRRTGETARTKTTMSWRSRGKKLRWQNKFGSALVGTRTPTNSSGLTTLFQCSRNGLQMNQMEKTKWNHAGTCGLGTKAILAGHLGHGMISLVEFVQTFPVVLSARGFQIIDKQSFLTIKAESNARQ